MALFDFVNKKKFEELKNYLEEGNYEEAVLVADRISERKVKSAYELNLLGKAYKKHGDFLQAKNIFERSYEIRCSKAVLMDIMDCCLETGDLESVEGYFNEYHKVAPEDRVTQYVYRYKIEKRKGRERSLLITILEELKALEYIEEYAYELAKQYHKAGMVQECMDECNDIILWFGFGPTVERAKTLLAYYRGEISLEEIKTAGARYQAELEHQWQEERAKMQQDEAEQSEEIPPVTEESKEEPVPELEWIQEEVQEPEAIIEESEHVEEAGETMPSGEEIAEDEEYPEPELPDIDLSGIVWGDETQENMQEELYEPVSAEGTCNVENEKLAELLRNQQVSISEVLKNFGRIERIQNQVIKSLELAMNDREKTYFVITGEPKTGKTTLALCLIRLLHALGMVKYDRTATLDAVQLNQVSIMDYVIELKNCNLIIENAGGMTKESIDGLIQFSKGSKGKICVILEDSIRNINKFLRAREELNSMFNNRIHLGKYSTEDLMGFAHDYIKKEDYCIDKMAAQVLRNKIDEIVKDYGNDQRLIRTLELVQGVVERAEKRTGELLLGMATEGKIQKGNYLVVIPEDVTL